ncbi:hypothetical protein FXB76_01680 [Aggregatibacter actinomycetemcomitans]|nr:hypothetical protein FXE10_02695 [Aggregatibacter actinomycetemcomitans]TYA33568.1 hypothetical protein FXB69_02695 [Aggregatibacter actinomycetemcomitans]TYB02313.1 hypothetical protein FXB93_02610 [Aggregatibacter actinomycetemcomitans]TYB16757.1 hypothetical protein FXB65_02680 [Aggregatibacter actinomycetemcomitans]TYB17725.1 hypothetical protein FXB76_01680 [Aggregatibacter actinomycetemcomitans]
MSVSTLPKIFSLKLRICFSMRCVRYEDFTELDKDEIKRLLSIQKLEIGQNLSLSRLYSPIIKCGSFSASEGLRKH